MDQDLTRLEELLCDRAVGALDARDLLELDGLVDDLDQVDEFELAAAAVDLAYTENAGEVPAELARNLEAAADAHLPAEDSRERPEPTPVAKFEPLRERPASRMPWLLAAAAVLLGVAGWWRALEPPKTVEIIKSVAVPPAPPPKEPSLAEARQQLADAEGTRVLPWTATKDPAASGAQGDVVWNTKDQAGFMRFKGLASNDPAEEQYQLWIFGKDHDERYPVDGGVFDVSPEGEVIVRIDPRLAVKEPALFAVTVEKPGGVVVSSRERIVLTAAVN